MKYKKFKTSLLILIISLYGCSTTIESMQKTTGSPFNPVSEFNENKALVYLYKPTGYGRSIFMVMVNEEKVVKIKNGGYYPYLAKPGTIDINIKKLARLGELLTVFEPRYRTKLTVEDGKTY